MEYITKLVDAHRPAMDKANSQMLPQTVFYHPDYGFDCAVALSPFFGIRSTLRGCQKTTSNRRPT